jgi:sentrin-specific protease 1
MAYIDKEEADKNRKYINKTERWPIKKQVNINLKIRDNFDNSKIKYHVENITEKNSNNNSTEKNSNKLNNKYRISSRQINMEGIVKKSNIIKDNINQKEKGNFLSYCDLRSYIIKFYKSLEGPFISKGYELHKDDLLILLSNRWLNDKIINCYLELLQDYDKDIYVFSTYFYTNLRNNGLSKVIKYTAKMDIFQYKYLFFPVHLDSHWVLVCLDVKKGILEYRDSFVKYNKKVMDDIEEYLLYERMRLYKERTVFSKFSITSVDVQYNGYDCGVFILMYAKYKLKNINKFRREMGYYRKKILYEIFTNKIVYEKDEEGR